MASEVFAGWLQSSMNEGIKRVVFVIGGPFGHDQVCVKRHGRSWDFRPWC